MPDFPRQGKAEEVWAYGTRKLTGFDGQPRTDLVGADNAIWSHASRSLTGLTGQPRTDLVGADESVDTHGFTAARAAKIDNLDAAVTSRPAAADYTAARAAMIDNLDAAISSRSSHSAADVWAVATRKLTGLDGQPRTDLLGEDADFEVGTGARKVRIDDIPGFETPVEATVAMDGTELVLAEKTDDKQGLLEGYVDLTPIQAGDTIVIRQYMKVKAAGSYVKYNEETYTDAQSIPLLNISTKAAKTAIKVTAQQTAGTNRSLDVQFFRRREA